MSVVKKIAKILAIIILSIVMLNVILIAIFSIPSVQKKAADFAIGKLENLFDTKISIERIHLKLFNTVEISNLYFQDRQNDTLLYAGTVRARLNPLNLLDHTLSIELAELSDFTAKVYRETADSTSIFNFQFIIDAFPKDSTKKANPNPLKIAINNIKLSNGKLRYDVLSAPQTVGEFNVNHIHADDFNLKADIASLDIKNLKGEIHSLRFRETNSKLAVKNIMGQVRSKNSEFHSKNLNVDLASSRIRISHALFNTQTKDVALSVSAKKIDPKEAAIFYSRLSSMTKDLSFKADLIGQLPSVTIENLDLTYGRKTDIKLSGSIKDYNKLEKSALKLNVSKLILPIEDLEEFIRIGPPDFESPSQMAALGTIDMSLKAEGIGSDFNADVKVNVDPGKISFKGKGHIANMFKHMAFDGDVSTTDLKVEDILGPDVKVRNASLDTYADVIIADSTLTVSATGNIGSVEYNNFVYKDINIDATYDNNHTSIFGNINADTEQNKFNIDIDLAFGNQMKLNFEGAVDKLFLPPLFTVKDWKNPYIAARIKSKLNGNTFDNMQGTVGIDSLFLYDDKFFYKPGTISLTAGIDETTKEKRLDISSLFLDAVIYGYYSFSSIGNEITNALRPYLPTILEDNTPIKSTRKVVATVAQPANRFHFDLLLKNTEDLSNIFKLPFINEENATIKGDVDMVESQTINIDALIPRLRFGNNDIREANMNLSNVDKSALKLKSDFYIIQNDAHAKIDINSDIVNDIISNRISFEVVNPITKSDGSLGLLIGFSRDTAKALVSTIDITPSSVFLNGRTIGIKKSRVVSAKDNIEILDFGLREKNQLLLSINGTASKKSSDSLSLYFTNTDVGNILSIFNIRVLDGRLNGKVSVKQALQNPRIQTHGLRFEDIVTNDTKIGDLSLDAKNDPDRDNGFLLDANLSDGRKKSLSIRGFVPVSDSLDINLAIKLQDMPLSWIQSFAASAFSEMGGSVSSDIQVAGKLSKPAVQGWVGINNGVMTIDYTGVTYQISDTIAVLPDRIGFKNLIIKDNNNHEAKLTFALSHSNLKNKFYNASLELNDFLLLNNDKRSDLTAHGNLKLSGKINLKGSDFFISGDANLRNTSVSNLTIEVPQTSTASEYGGIIYVDRYEDIDSLAFMKEAHLGHAVHYVATTIEKTTIPINFKAKLNLNPMFKANVILDPISGNNLSIKGKSNLNIVFDSKATPSVMAYGDYIVDEGTFKYSFQKVKTIDFRIQEGSKVSLIGNPLNTQFDIMAYKDVTADVSTLSDAFSSQMVNTRIPVKANLKIRGNLERMELNPDVEIPSANDDAKQRLKSLMSTEQQRYQQFASLVLFGTFASNEEGQQKNFNANSVAAGLLSMGLDAIFDNFLNENWSINTNINPQEGRLANTRMGVGATGSLFNNRLKIKADLTYGDNKMMANDTPFLGEIELTYSLTNWLMLKFYNRANQRYYFRRSPTTQGIGIVVTKDTQRFRDLFKFRFGKENTEK